MILFFLAVRVAAQTSSIDLTFTAIDDATSVELDSIKVMNRTQGGDTLLVWPDTVLSLTYVGIPEMGRNGDLIKVFQNYPNPVTDQTTISVYVPDKDQVTLAITDMLGRVVHTSTKLLDKGLHSFRFTPGGSNFYFFTARYRGISSSIKILQVSSGSDAVCSLDYIGSESSFPPLKTVEDFQAFRFNKGDELLFIGYANGLESGIMNAPQENQSYVFQFATNIPCPGMQTVEYEGQVYNTIQIMSQCWLKENMNVGTMIQGNQNALDNGIVEKYCYNNNPDNCSTYGGLYMWNEMMQYTTTPRTRGICPQGWHVPEIEEWRVLFGAVDSQFGIGATEWDLPPAQFLGYDVGTNLKSISGWIGNGNGTDLFGFSALPGGYHHTNGYFNGVGEAGNLHTSNEIDFSDAAHLFLGYDLSGIGLSDFMPKTYGISLRCIRDE